MAIEVKRKENETVGSLLRRFSQKIKQSGVLNSARRGRFYVKPKNKRQVHAGAKRREQLRALRTRLLKEGVIKEGELIPRDIIKTYEFKK